MRTKRSQAKRRRDQAAGKPAAKTNKLANLYAVEGTVRGSIDLPFLVIVLVLLLMGCLLYTSMMAAENRERLAADIAARIEAYLRGQNPT